MWGKQCIRGPVLGTEAPGRTAGQRSLLGGPADLRVLVHGLPRLAPQLAIGESIRLVLWARCVRQPPWLQETAIVSPWPGQHGASMGGKDRGRQKGWTGGWKVGTWTCTGREAGGARPTTGPTGHVEGATGPDGRGHPLRPPLPLTTCQLVRRPAALAGGPRPRSREARSEWLPPCSVSRDREAEGSAQVSPHTQLRPTGMRWSARPPDFRWDHGQGGEAGTARGG